MPYIGQRPSKGDENNFKILDDISSYTLTFDGSDASVVSAANDTITSLNHRFAQGQRVTYNKGGGSVIAGLSDGVYYIIKHDHHTIKLATSASNATNGIAVNITGVGGGSSHTLNVAFDGINTKFKATHTNGQKAKITRSAQLVISINGVIQQPHDSATPSTGFGFDLDGTIVLSQAPVAGDVYWAHVLTNNNVTFDISDNDVDNFTGDGSTVSFNLSKTPPDNRNILVTIDGVVQYPNDPDGTARAYNVVENVLTFTTAPDANVQIQVRHIGFAGSTSGGGGGVTNFYGRTGSVVLKNTDNIVANNAEFAGNLTVQGTMTTLDTKVTEVDQLEVGANNTTVGVAITQSGSGDILKMFSGSTLRVQSEVDGNFRIKSGTQYKGLKVLNDVGNTVGEMVGLSTINDAGAMSLWNGGTKKVQLSAVGASYLTGGGVGIGTNTLFTSGAHSGTHQLTVTDNAPSMSLGVSNTDQLYVRRELADGKYTFQTNQGGGNGGVISLQPYGGSVGIGSATPAQKLDVVGTSKFQGEVSISSGNQLKLANDANTANVTLDCDGGARLNVKSYSQSVIQAQENWGVKFLQGTGTERFTIEPTGGVVVGAGGTIKIPDKMMHVGDEDTYLQFTPNTINLHAGGTTGITVYDTNVRIPTKLGINGATPSTPLDVIANASGYAMAIRGRSSDNIGEIRFTSNDYGSALYSSIQTGPTYLNIQVGSTTNALRITSDGKVGINDSAPANQLVVKAPGGSGHTVASVVSGDATTRVTMQAVQGTEGRMGMATNHPLALYAGGLEKLRIETSGDLQLYNADSIIHTSADTSRLRLFGGSSNSVNNGAALTLHGVSHSGGNYADLASGSGGHIQFRIGTSEKLRITNTGAVGIGSTNPENHLLELYTAASADWKFRIHTNVSDGAGFYQRANGDFEMVLRDASNNNNFISGNGGDLEFATSGTEKLRITSGGEVGISPASCTPTAGDLSSGDSQNTPIIHVKGSGTSATGGVYNLLARFEAGGDADETGAMIVLNHSNDRGLAIQGGRRTGNYAHGALKMIDNVGRLSNAIFMHGGAGQGVNHMGFYTGESTTTTERLRINSTGDIGINFDGTPNGTLDIRTDRDPSNGLMCFIRNNAQYGNGAFYGMDVNSVGTWSIGMPDNSNVLSVRNGGQGNSGTEYLRIDSTGSLFAGGTVITESDMNWTHDTYQRPHIFSGKTGGNPADGSLVLASPETNPSNTRVGSIVFGCKTSSTTGVSNSGLKAVIDCYTNTNTSDAWKTGASMNFSVRRDNGNLENKFQITKDGIVVRRQDSGNEGGEVMLCRPSDDTPYFHIDAFGASGATPGNTNDWVSNAKPTMRIHTGGIEIFKIGTNGNIKLPHNPVFCGVYQNGSSVNVGSDVTVIFDDTVYINKGAGQTGSGAPYDTSTGEFTCPSAGYYQVYVQAHLQSQTGGAYSSWRIQKNGVTQSNAWKADGSGGSLVASVILNCAGDDTIRARFVSNETTQYTNETYWVLYILKVG